MSNNEFTPNHSQDKKIWLPEGHVPNAKPSSEIFAHAMKELARPYPSTPLSRFPQLNKMIGGLRPNEFSIVCGSTGVGKSTFMADISAGLISDEVSHFVASVETGATDFIRRQISALQGEDWNQGDAVGLEKLKTFTGQYKKVFDRDACHLSLYDNRFPVETLIADIEWHRINKGAGIAIVDNLNFFMEVTRAADSVIEMDRVVHELIIYCKQVPIHIIMVMHPRKTMNGRVESEFDIKGSSTSVQEAHNVFLFNGPHPNRLKDGSLTSFDRELTIAKMRRKGRFVRSTLVLHGINGIRYEEGSIIS